MQQGFQSDEQMDLIVANQLFLLAALWRKYKEVVGQSICTQQLQKGYGWCGFNDITA